MLTIRPLRNEDAEIICRFPRSEEELFFMYPKTVFPFQPSELLRAAYERHDPVVVLYNGKIAGYANFIHAIEGEYCTIGNVITNPEIRRKGIATFLIKKQVKMAVEKYNVKSIRLTCFSENTGALLFYRKLGFIPYDLNEMKDYRGKPVAAICFSMNRETAKNLLKS